ncbi:MAG: hypothetical protein JJ953_03035 [Gracilimonas sp.]|uniref:hypothetical protein n=1 Tax=Gracilimonas TaxID=649462 RepID=UPI001B26BC48|nr:hypothetical protein [Gracilimonas sp.]MBO6585060.1 hypothetical protein [Gracilimonas sp.]MBO6615669.1 hypothetical protein [Gracilimonas sp.]
MFSGNKKTNSTNSELQQVYDNVANLMLYKNIKRDEITQKLIDEGFNQQDAEFISNDVATALIENQRKSGLRSSIFGTIMFLVGAAITIPSLFEGGIIAYGAVFMGFILLVGGLIKRKYAEKRFIGKKS